MISPASFVVGLPIGLGIGWLLAWGVTRMTKTRKIPVDLTHVVLRSAPEPIAQPEDKPVPKGQDTVTNVTNVANITGPLPFSTPKLEQELTIDEGCQTMPYRDTRGFLTVGIGHNLDAGPIKDLIFPLTRAEIDTIFQKDVASCLVKLDANLPWWRTQSDARQRVLINMTFNLGIGVRGKSGLMEFGTFLNLVQTKQYPQAADDMLHTLWAKQVGQRAVRLAAMMKAG